MGWQALGDSAWLYRVGDDGADVRLHHALALAARLREVAIPGVTDVVNGYDTVAVFADPAIAEEVGEAVREVTADLSPSELPEGRLVEIPVRYGGADLEEVARRLGLGVDEVITRHSAAGFTVATVGFAPGFPYLAGLPQDLRLPRKETPLMVEAGSVAIAAGQAGIYPIASPAGWWVLGKTAVPMFDAAAPEPGLLRPGDRVRFVAVDELARPPRAEAPSPEGPIEVLDPGAMTTIQDEGRPGFRRWGVAPGGAADPVAMAVANAMAGNAAGAAVLEVCMMGPRLRFHQAARAAWCGWSGGARSADFAAGEELDLRAGLGSVRGYLAIAGGLDVEPCLGSRSTDLRGGFGGRVVMAGDRLRAGRSAGGPAPGAWRVGWPPCLPPASVIEVRVMRGVQASWFGPAELAGFFARGFQISPRADRMGMRLDGPRVTPPEREMVSQPVVPGSVQVPPDGVPIVLLPEGQTLGGYPQIAHVIAADLPQLGRLWPGTTLHFREVGPAEALQAWLDLRAELARLRTGLDLLKRG
ncbi:5-oxoprolinase subunit PxpB [Haloferula sargassicola]|uniref:Urea amidolyase n=1 Tax=Haloferula sargassicola TaxID=490096 RepID=A0ABP9UJE9_9BACT